MKDITYALYDFPCCRLKIGYSDSAIHYIVKSDEEGSGTASEMSELAAKELDEYFSGKRKSFDLPLEPQGTEFQRKVWNALLEIPYGETRSYKDIAEKIRNPRACRAVGGANNKNPIVILIPCHRVVGSHGGLVGYGLGLPMKQQLLDIEKGKG